MRHRKVPSFNGLQADPLGRLRTAKTPDSLCAGLKTVVDFLSSMPGRLCIKDATLTTHTSSDALGKVDRLSSNSTPLPAPDTSANRIFKWRGRALRRRQMSR